LKKAQTFKLHFVGKRFYTIPSFEEEAKRLGVQRAVSFSHIKQLKLGEPILLAQFTNTSRVKRKRVGSAEVFGYFTFEGISHTLPVEVSNKLNNQLSVSSSNRVSIPEIRECGRDRVAEIATIRNNVETLLENINEIVEKPNRKPHRWFVIGEYKPIPPAQQPVVKNMKFNRGISKIEITGPNLKKLKTAGLKKRRVTQARLVRLEAYEPRKYMPKSELGKKLSRRDLEATTLMEKAQPRLDLRKWKMAGRPRIDEAEPPQPMMKMVKERHIPPYEEKAVMVAAPRWIQGQVFRVGSKSEQTRSEAAFLEGSRYRLYVRIGPADRDWLTPSEEDVFPEEKLDWKKGKVNLQVVFNEPNHSPEPQVKNIILPKYGPSSVCQFRFRVSGISKTFLGRIVVLHKNRVIQTALLKGQVLSSSKQKPEYPMQLSIESLIRKNLSDLESRPKFDVALIANHTESGESTVTAITKKRAAFDSLKNSEPIVNQINEMLEKIVIDPTECPIDIFGDKFTSWLRGLAILGRKLYEGIVIDIIRDNAIKNAKRIQLLSKRVDYLPLEFLYDASPPRMNARLCPKTKEALEKGECIGCKVKDGVPPAKYICPLGFWFLKMIIERHLLADPELKEEGSEFVIEFEPVANREKLQVLSSALFAASSKINAVDPNSTKKLFSTLNDATNKKATLAKTWSEWKKAIKTTDPSLLLIITHTSKGGPHNEDQMEIGGKSTLFQIHITKTLHVKRSQTNKPVLLLLGCSTGVSHQPLGGRGGTQVDVPFQTYAAKFAREGAVIVVSTLTKILGRHAGPVAETLIEELQRSAQGEKSLGDTLLQTRKRYFLEGIPMALTLLANGDADWQFSLSGGD
jgi:hypothetical protein